MNCITARNKFDQIAVIRLLYFHHKMRIESQNYIANQYVHYFCNRIIFGGRRTHPIKPFYVLASGRALSPSLTLIPQAEQGLQIADAIGLRPLCNYRPIVVFNKSRTCELVWPLSFEGMPLPWSQQSNPARRATLRVVIATTRKAA